MEREISEQAGVLGGLAARFDELTQLIRAGSQAPRGVAFLARGSSDHAALLGRYAVELHTGLPTCLLAPSLITAYGRPPTGFAGWLAVGLSQSGRTPEILSLAARLQRSGATVVSITNDDASELAANADISITLAAGPERAVPATKTVTAQMLAVLAVAAALTSDPGAVINTAGIAPAVEQVLADTGAVGALAAELAPYRRLAVVARGLCYPAAKETALKVQETTGAMAHGFSTADFRHGPVAVCGPDAPAVLFVGSGPADPDTSDLAKSLTERGARSVVIGPESGQLRWPAADGATECLLATIRGQQLALQLCRALGVDPDAPAGLNKVTLTH